MASAGRTLLSSNGAPPPAAMDTILLRLTELEALREASQKSYMEEMKKTQAQLHASKVTCGECI